MPPPRPPAPKINTLHLLQQRPRILLRLAPHPTRRIRFKRHLPRHRRWALLPPIPWRPRAIPMPAIPITTPISRLRSRQRPPTIPRPRMRHIRRLIRAYWRKRARTTHMRRRGGRYPVCLLLQTRAALWRRRGDRLGVIRALWAIAALHPAAP